MSSACELRERPPLVTRAAIRPACALLLYVGLVVWLTWPLASNLTTRLPYTQEACRYDTLNITWVLSYESHCLTTDPFGCLDANIYYPARKTLFYGVTGLAALPYFMPTFLLTGNPALALNLVFLGSLVLTACALHFVVWKWTCSHLAGFIAAWTILTSRWVLWWFVPTNPSYAVMQYFPLIILFASTPAERFLDALKLVPLVAAQCLSDPIYVATAVIVPLLCIAVVRLARPGTRRAGLLLLTGVGLALLMLAPVYAGYLVVRLRDPEVGQHTYWRSGVIATLLPWGPLGRQDSPTAVAFVVPLLVIAGALGLALRRKSGPFDPSRNGWAHAALWTAVAFVASLTPTVQWYLTPVRLPQVVLRDWSPLYQFLRSPERVAIGALVGLSLLAGTAFAECTRRLHGSRLAACGRLLAALAIVTTMYLEYSRSALEPRPVRRKPLPREYALARAIQPSSRLIEILRRSGGPLLELPAGHRDDPLWPVSHARAMYRSIFHWQKLLNGYHSYWPLGFPERMALASRLPERQALDSLRRQTGLEMILVHTRSLRGNQRRIWHTVERRGGSDGLELIARDGGDLLFRISTSVPGAQMGAAR